MSAKFANQRQKKFLLFCQARLAGLDLERDETPARFDDANQVAAALADSVAYSLGPVARNPALVVPHHHIVAAAQCEPYPVLRVFVFACGGHTPNVRLNAHAAQPVGFW